MGEGLMGEVGDVTLFLDYRFGGGLVVHKDFRIFEVCRYLRDLG